MYRFRFCLARHIQFLASFDGVRACDRRLKILVDNGYLNRKKIIYGIPYLYYLSKNGMRLIHVKVKDENIRIDQIHHDITTLDCLKELVDKYNFQLDNMTTERELHINDGFGVRKHHPDLVFKKDDETYAIEVELNVKAKNRILKNIEDNYLNYDYQIWVVPLSQVKIKHILTESLNKYDNIEVVTLESLLS
ncbi:hypothetical protein [Thomasclavelia spiroformis]|uniref:hypothetical protein n=1 Tax=Thomasclavelia spiroformis TaxID=29348 RepID=UPI00241F7C37|nr:hypothetical protein [Thomasclavelia spiroformis]MBS6685213.1 hypothetical protein [Thomasclavelia spiroformis]